MSNKSLSSFFIFDCCSSLETCKLFFKKVLNHSSMVSYVSQLPIKTSYKNQFWDTLFILYTIYWIQLTTLSPSLCLGITWEFDSTCYLSDHIDHNLLLHSVIISLHPYWSRVRISSSIWLKNLFI